MAFVYSAKAPLRFEEAREGKEAKEEWFPSELIELPSEEGEWIETFRYKEAEACVAGKDGAKGEEARCVAAKGEEARCVAAKGEEARCVAVKGEEARCVAVKGEPSASLIFCKVCVAKGEDSPAHPGCKICIAKAQVLNRIKAVGGVVNTEDSAREICLIKRVARPVTKTAAEMEGKAKPTGIVREIIRVQEEYLQRLIDSPPRTPLLPLSGESLEFVYESPDLLASIRDSAAAMLSSIEIEENLLEQFVKKGYADAELEINYG